MFTLVEEEGTVGALLAQVEAVPEAANVDCPLEQLQCTAHEIASDPTSRAIRPAIHVLLRRTAPIKTAAPVLADTVCSPASATRFRTWLVNSIEPWEESLD
jgi:hypothetical protein